MRINRAIFKELARR